MARRRSSDVDRLQLVRAIVITAVLFGGALVIGFMLRGLFGTVDWQPPPATTTTTVTETHVEIIPFPQ